MNAVLAALARHGAASPGRTAITDGELSIGYRQLHCEVTALAARIRSSGACVVGLALDDGPAWLMTDLAVLAARIAGAPIPAFFSRAQQLHLLRDAGIDCVITDRADDWTALLHQARIGVARCFPVTIAGRRHAVFRLAHERLARELPGGTAKVTYTSGTTGTPRGVCLTDAALCAVATSLARACELTPADRHASLLPLATLLENVAVYAQLVGGGCALLQPIATPQAGTGLDGARLLARLSRAAATTAVVVPEMLRAMTEAAAHGAPAPASLRFLAVGGAPVAVHQLARARRLGLPVFEGYGLSECASVVTLNTRASDRAGTVGRPLPHAEIRISPRGEVLVRGAVFAGYAGQSPHDGPWYATGDLGHIDEDGFLRLTGRARNVFITAYGRNVAPEWVESELTAHPAIAQAWVHGEARPWNAAVIVARPGASRAEVDAAVSAANAILPDYARITRWMSAAAPFTAARGELTPNGRLKRAALLATYGNSIDSLYCKDLHDVS